MNDALIMALKNKMPLTSAQFEYMFMFLLCPDLSIAEQQQATDCLRLFTALPLSADHLTQAVLYLRSQMIPVIAPDDAVDCCGTGGDTPKTGGSVNISTAVAFWVASMGVKVAKHGNRSVSSKCGAADLLEALGYPIASNSPQASQQLMQTGLSFLFAPTYHHALKHVAPIRKALGIKTIFNILGPLLNPAGVKKQLIGVSDKNLMPMIAQTLRQTGTKRALLVHSHEGADELTLTGDNYYLLLNEGNLQEGTLSPHDVGLPFYPADALQGGDIAYNLHAFKNLCAGGQGAYRDTVLLNAGALLYVAGKAPSIKEGVALAQTVKKIDLGNFCSL